MPNNKDYCPIVSMQFVYNEIKLLLQVINE
jgi:hypothetical protein